jgi:hypothetical protein
VRAHETLREIQELSKRLEGDEFWTRHRRERPDVLYSLRVDAFSRGPISKTYLGAAHQTFPTDIGIASDSVEMDGDRTIQNKLYTLLLNGASAEKDWNFEL